MKDVISLYRALNIETKKNNCLEFIQKCQKEIDKNLVQMLFTFNHNQLLSNNAYFELENSIERYYSEQNRMPPLTIVLNSATSFYERNYTQDELSTYIEETLSYLINR